MLMGYELQGGRVLLCIEKKRTSSRGVRGEQEAAGRDQFMRDHDKSGIRQTPTKDTRVLARRVIQPCSSPQSYNTHSLPTPSRTSWRLHSPLPGRATSSWPRTPPRRALHRQDGKLTRTKSRPFSPHLLMAYSGEPGALIFYVDNAKLST